MRECEPRQRPLEVAPLEHLWRESVRTADEKSEVTAVLQALGQPRCELARGHLDPMLVERHHVFILAYRAQETLRFGFNGFLRRFAAGAITGVDLQQGDLERRAEPR